MHFFTLEDSRYLEIFIPIIISFLNISFESCFPSALVAITNTEFSFDNEINCLWAFSEVRSISEEENPCTSNFFFFRDSKRIFPMYPELPSKIIFNYIFVRREIILCVYMNVLQT